MPEPTSLLIIILEHVHVHVSIPTYQTETHADFLRACLFNDTGTFSAINKSMDQAPPNIVRSTIFGSASKKDAEWRAIL